MERIAYWLTAAFIGERYRTYPIYCEDEVKSHLKNPGHQFDSGPLPFSFNFKIKGTIYDDSAAWVLEDDNFISARWPGDAYLFGKRLRDKILSASK